MFGHRRGGERVETREEKRFVRVGRRSARWARNAKEAGGGGGRMISVRGVPSCILLSG